MKQPTLFDFLPEIEPTTTNTLIIGKQTAKTLSKSQQIFNRLSQKIENLQDELQSKTKILDECLMFYGNIIHPLEQEMLILQKEVTKLLYKFYMKNKFVVGNLGNKKRQILKDIICVQLDNILCGDKNEPDEEIKHIYQNIFGVSYEAVAKEGFSEIINEMESMFSNMGLDVDLSDIDIKSGEEDIFRKIKEIEEKAKRHLENKQATQGVKKKTKKQLAKELQEQQIEEARNRNISSIYKQLAKVLHPDLEQDTAIKIEKESLMKQLTAAYEAHDLHMLLRLEIQWIHKENSHLETLSENKLEIYIQLLKEQIKELEEECYMLSHHPRYLPLNEFYHESSLPNIQILTSKKNQMKEVIGSLNHSIQRLKGDDPLSELRDIIRIFSKT
ncbi:MAG: hypothetical protein A2Z47_03010 [Thermodesulfovibrio sp. RBG_19FT_COMBO_42_12]|nr:MAG: hypothetical protein A2Z47_03010 [Thermodesulfovibrio sp. RBG_19FT_COMBO_42_12]